MVPFIWPVTDPRTCILINGLAYRMTSTTKRVGTNWFIRRFFVGRRTTFRESELTWCRLLSPSPRAIHFQPIWQPFTFNERSTCRISSKTLPWRRVHLILKSISVVQHQTLCSVCVKSLTTCNSMCFRATRSNRPSMEATQSVFFNVSMADR